MGAHTCALQLQKSINHCITVDRKYRKIIFQLDFKHIMYVCMYKCVTLSHPHPCFVCSSSKTALYCSHELAPFWENFLSGNSSLLFFR